MTEQLPTFPMPPFARLRIAFNEAFGRRDAAVRLRWAVYNATEPRVCLCGAPAAVAIGHAVGPVFYHCDRHRNVSLFARWKFNRGEGWTVENENGDWSKIGGTCLSCKQPTRLHPPERAWRTGSDLCAQVVPRGEGET